VSDASDYTVVVHGERRRIPHVELEIRQDLLATDAGQREWAERLAAVLQVCLAEPLPPLAPGALSLG
jgi:predicted N-formylglutamate amidohydrolase